MPTLSLSPSRGHWGAGSARYKVTHPVAALSETHSPRPTQIGKAKHKTSLLFMIYFKTTLLMIRDLFMNSQGWNWELPKHEVIPVLPHMPPAEGLFGKGGLYA